MAALSLPSPAEVDRIGILGSGLIGASWAALFLACGKDVRASDPAPGGEAALRGFIDEAWPALERLGLAEGADPGRVSFEADPTTALQDLPFIQESAPEALSVKQELYQRIEPHIPEDCVVASSSSGLMISDLQPALQHPERLLLGHPFNPPHLIPLVEVVGGKQTAPDVIDWTLAFYAAHRKKAIHIKKEVPAHVANRLQAAIWREAVHLVADGVASVADVDAAIAYGPGLRWALMGPHLTFHLAGGPGGMENFMKLLGPATASWWDDLGHPELTPEVMEKIIAGVAAETGDRSIEDLAAERDRRLLALLEALQQS